MRSPQAATTVFLATLTLAGCVSTVPATKPWHGGWAAPREAVYGKEHSLVASGRDARGEPTFTPVWYVRLPPDVPYSKLRMLKVGDRGEAIQALTRPTDPVYPADGAVVRTSLAGVKYEVAFRYSRSRPGIIDDISFRPVAGLVVPDPGVTHPD